MPNMRTLKGSVCFLCESDQILLLQRNHEPFKGKWDGLQGLAEFGETPIETARREVYEESGLTIGDCHHRGHLLLYNVESCLMIAADLIVATSHQGTLGESEEGRPVWVPVSAIPHIDLIGFMHTTLPLVLRPDTFLIGTIRHLPSGDPASYELHHHRIGETKALIYAPET